MFELNPNKLKVSQGWGSDNHHTVYPYQKSSSDLRYVVKQLRVKDFDEFLVILQSIVIGYNCQHQSILSIKGYSVKQREPQGYEVYVKMPRMEQNLQDVIHQSQGEQIPESEIIGYFYSLISGLEYLHEKKIAHQNIKLKNALLHQDGRLQLSDVGLTTTLKKSKKKINLYKEDISNLGLLIASLCQLGEISEGSIEIALEEIEKKYSHSLTDIIRNMLTACPDSRKACKEIKIYLEKQFPNFVIKAPNNDLPEKIHQGHSQYSRGKMVETIREIESRWKESFHFESAEDFHLKITNKSKVDDKALEDLMKDIIQTNNRWDVNEVPSFHLDLTGCSKITDEGVEQLWRETNQNLKNLQDLALYFPWCANISDVGIGKLCKDAGGKNKNLEKLALYFSKCTNITDDGVLSLSKNISESFRRLKRLDLYLSWCSNITDKGLVEIGNQICLELKELTNLVLYFSCCSEITNEGINELTTSINKNLFKLQQLALKFNGCSKVTDDGLKYISQNLNQNQSELQQLSLDFYGCLNLTNEGIKYLSESIGKHFFKLKELTLYFSNCAKINDIGLSYLGTSMNRNLESLENLNLNFFHCGISDEGIQKLGQGICNHLKDLKSLVISFASCHKISDNGVKYITQSIGQNLKNLEVLSLDFSCCDKITDGSVKPAILNIGQNLKNLDSLALYFSKCYQVTMLIDDSIIQALASIPKVKVW